MKSLRREPTPTAQAACNTGLTRSAERVSLFDVQVNGFAGVDFQNPNISCEDLLSAVRELAKHGMRRFFLTLITDEIGAMETKFRRIEGFRSRETEIGEAVCGYHLEGPWISHLPGFRGAHDPSAIKAPVRGDFDRLQRAAENNIRLVTLAPELPGCVEFIRGLTARGVAVSIGHSDASWKDIEAAIEAGARFCTHLGNGVPEMLPRHANVVQMLLARDELTAFFIPDGIHLPPPTLKNFFRAKPDGKAVFTTDCMSAAGAPGGSHRLGKIEVEVGGDRVVRLPGSGQFAGSALVPERAVENASRWIGIQKDRARELFSSVVAAHFGIDLPFCPPNQEYETT